MYSISTRATWRRWHRIGSDRAGIRHGAALDALQRLGRISSSSSKKKAMAGRRRHHHPGFVRDPGAAAAQAVRFAVSRQREFLADATSVS